MQNKKLMICAGFALAAAAVLLTAVLPEKSFYHVWYQLIALSVIMLSAYISAKDTAIIVLLSSCVVWGMGFYDVINQMHQLMLETSVIMLIVLAFGLYGHSYSKEKSSRDAVISYKKGEIDAAAARISEMSRENHRLTDELKSMRKYFSH